jgi:hypothetical protein
LSNVLPRLAGPLAGRVQRQHSQIKRQYLHNPVPYALQGLYVDPHDPDTHELLADLYEKIHNDPAAARERKTLAILEDWSKSGTPPPKTREAL